MSKFIAVLACLALTQVALAMAPIEVTGQGAYYFNPQALGVEFSSVPQIWIQMHRAGAHGRAKVALLFEKEALASAMRSQGLTSEGFRSGVSPRIQSVSPILVVGSARHLKSLRCRFEELLSMGEADCEFEIEPGKAADLVRRMVVETVVIAKAEIRVGAMTHTVPLLAGPIPPEQILAENGSPFQFREALPRPTSVFPLYATTGELPGFVRRLSGGATLVEAFPKDQDWCGVVTQLVPITDSEAFRSQRMGLEVTVENALEIVSFRLRSGSPAADALPLIKRAHGLKSHLRLCTRSGGRFWLEKAQVGPTPRVSGWR